MKTRFVSRCCQPQLKCLAAAVIALSGSTPVFADEAPPKNAPAVVAANPQLDRALLDHLRKNQWDKALQVLSSGAGANASDKSGMTALMLATQGGQLTIVSALLDRGADAKAINKAGQTALHLATTIGQPKPKKKKFGGFAKALGGAVLGGGLMGGLSGVGHLGGLASGVLGSGSLESMLGGNLQSLLGGGAFNLMGKSGWTAIVGTALQSEISSQGAFGLQNVLISPGAASANAALNAKEWVSLMSAVQSSNASVLPAMAQLAGPSAGASAKWNQFLGAAARGDQATVETLLQDKELAPVLEQATQGFRAATADLPANAASNIVAQLINHGADAKVVDKSGQTAAQLAQTRGWYSLAAQLLEAKPDVPKPEEKTSQEPTPEEQAPKDKTTVEDA